MSSGSSKDSLPAEDGNIASAVMDNAVDGGLGKLSFPNGEIHLEPPGPKGSCCGALHCSKCLAGVGERLAEHAQAG